MLAGQYDFEVAEQSLAIAEAFGIDDLRASVLITLGTMRTLQSEIAGTEMIQEGLDIALAGNYLDAALRAYTNLASMAHALQGDLRASLQHLRDAERIVAKLGTNTQKRSLQGNILNDQLEIGEWDECRYGADEFIRESAAGAPHYHDAMVFMERAFIKLARGDVEGALADQSDGLAAARRTKDPQVLHAVLAISAYILALAGRHESAESFFDELLAQGPARVTALGCSLGDALRAADALGRLNDAETWLGADQPSAWYTVGRAIIDGDHVGAADQLDRMGAVRSAALARLRAAQHLDEQGQPIAVAEQLAPALAFFRSVGASFFVTRAEALVAASA
jgi:tetratricopeptide (TPR) repeat protein